MGTDSLGNMKGAASNSTEPVTPIPMVVKARFTKEPLLELTNESFRNDLASSGLCDVRFGSKADMPLSDRLIDRAFSDDTRAISL